MKSHKKVVLSLLGLAVMMPMRGMAVDRGHTLRLDEICNRWGKTQFESKSFRAGDAHVRASMACDLVKSQKFKGGPVGKVPEELGRPDGYFGSERVPAYIIEDNRKLKRLSWQLVFYPNSEQNVAEVFVQENGSEIPDK